MAGAIPREFIDLLLSRIDIVQLISTHLNLTKKSNNNYFACCPFHQENSPSFSVSQNKQFYYCFGCGAHGNAIDFMIHYDRLSFPEAIEALAKLANLDLPTQSSYNPKKYNELATLHELTHKVARNYYQQLKNAPQAIEYLKKRGITGQIAQQFCLGYAPNEWDHLIKLFGNNANEQKKLLDCGLIISKKSNQFYDRFRHRIIFPIQDYRGRVIGFGGRVLDQSEPKYLNSPETLLFQKGHELYGLYHAIKASHNLKRIVLVEGYMDVIALFQYGITYAVATLGTATTAHHFHRLFRYTSEIIFCFDGDQAGKTAAWRALQTLLPLLNDQLLIRFLFLPEQEDPDSLVRKLGKDGFEKKLDTAQPLSQFFFQKLLNKSELSTHEGRAKFTADALHYIQQIPDSIFKQMLQTELEQRARIKLQLSTPKKNHTHGQNAILPGKLRSAIRLNASRLAAALLIQNPELGTHANEAFPAVQNPHLALLNQLVQIMVEAPGLTSAQIVERFRDTPQAEPVFELAHYQHQIPEDGLVSEFEGAMRQAHIEALDEIIDSLLAKSANQILSSSEKMQLSEYIAQKKHLSNTQAS